MALSSLFVYNQLGAIDEAALDRLALVVQVAQKLTGGADAGGEAFSPAFLWLLRDFYLQLHTDADAYLEEALAPVPEAGGEPAVAAARSKNGIRKGIKSLFRDRACFTLVRPVTDEAQLQRLDELPRSALRPEFAAGIDALTVSILARAAPKRLGGDVLTGPALARLAVTFVDALNAGAVPPIASAWEAVAAAECAAAAAIAGSAYDAAFDGKALAGAEEAAMAAAHSAALAAAQTAFDAGAVGPTAVRTAAWKPLATTLERRFGDALRAARAEATSACASALAAATEAVQAAAAAPAATMASVQAAVDAAVKTYGSVGRGAGKDGALAAWLAHAAPRALAAAADAERRRDAAAAASSAAAERTRLEAAAKDALSRGDAAAAELRTRLAAAEARAAAAEKDVALLRAQLTAATASGTELGGRVAAAETAAAHLETRLATATARLEQAGATERELRARLGAAEQAAQAAEADAEAIRAASAAAATAAAAQAARLEELKAEASAEQEL